MDESFQEESHFNLTFRSTVQAGSMYDGGPGADSVNNNYTEPRKKAVEDDDRKSVRSNKSFKRFLENR